MPVETPVFYAEDRINDLGRHVLCVDGGKLQAPLMQQVLTIGKLSRRYGAHRGRW